MPVTTTRSQAVLPSGLPVYVATPAKGGPYPSIVWLHERYGLVQHTMTYAHKLAAEGYAVIAPDIYYDLPDQDGLHNGRVAVPTYPDLVVEKRLEEAVAHLGEHERADTSRLGMIGVCASGRWPIVYGSRNALQAAVIYYGATRGWEVTDDYPETVPAMVDRMDSRFLGIFGELDNLIPIEEVRAFRNLLEDQDKSYRIFVYEDAPHGFINDTMPGRYRPAPEFAAFGEMMRLFVETLGEGGPDKDFVRWHFESVKAADYDFSTHVRWE